MLANEVLSSTIPRLTISIKSFLQHNDNKTDLFRLLASSLVGSTNARTVVATFDGAVVTNCKDYNLESLAPCNHEEADSRIFVHGYEAAKAGCKRAVIKTKGTGCCDDDRF